MPGSGEYSSAFSPMVSRSTLPWPRYGSGGRSGNPETTPGGQALKFYSSVRLDIRRIGQIKLAEEAIGSRVRVKVVKNKSKV